VLAGGAIPPREPAPGAGLAQRFTWDSGAPDICPGHAT
jgi:hypothetical protein